VVELVGEIFRGVSRVDKHIRVPSVHWIGVVKFCFDQPC